MPLREVGILQRLRVNRLARRGGAAQQTEFLHEIFQRPSVRADRGQGEYKPPPVRR